MTKGNAMELDLYRGFVLPLELRANETGDQTTLFGYFARFNTWTTIDSYWEGRFLEQIAPGAFRKTIKERGDRVRVQFDHGFDSFVGSAPLGPVETLREDGDIGPYYEVPLLDTDYNRNRILPLLQGRTLDGRSLGSLLGASFRMNVLKDSWDKAPKRSDHNPEGLPERTIKEIRLFEFGPVVFPAYPDATAAARSLTDHYAELRGKLRPDDEAGRPPTPQGAEGGETTPDDAVSRTTPYALALAARQRYAYPKR